MILTYDKSLIKKIGVQGSKECGIYAKAYGWCILEKKVRSGSVVSAYNNGITPNTYWTNMTCHSSSIRGRYKAIIKELNAGRPVVVTVQGSTANHYITVIGYRDGKTGDNIEPKDFYIIDPADNKIGWFGSTWAHGFNGSSYGICYNTFNAKGVGKTGSIAEADHPKSWYTEKYGNEAVTYFALRDLGYSHKGTCATMGNIAQESNFRTEVISGDGYGSQGMCQWTGDRLTGPHGLKTYAKNNGLNWKKVVTQCKFLDYELKRGYKSLRKRLIAGEDKLYTLTYDFCFTFERPLKSAANMSNRSNKASTYYDRYKKAYGGGGGEGDYSEEGIEQVAINMQQRASQLYSSDNYKWLTKEEEKESEEQKQAKAARLAYTNYIENVKFRTFDLDTSGIPDSYLTMPKGKSRGRLIKTASDVMPISQAMVEAPFVEVDFAGTTIGTYRNSVDNYPNHISSLEVEKVNGEINKYVFNLTHQIRPGEDPNLIDKIISKVRYDKIGITYGDFNSNVIYGDEKAIITNVSMNRDYVNSRISYTIYATSANELVTSHKINFPSRVDKPSNVIRSLLYTNAETSQLLLDAFPGMKNLSLVNSRNCIPTNDSIVDIDEQINTNSIEYINYLVSLMSNSASAIDEIVRKSTYYISYENDFNNRMGGAYFNIREQSVQKLNSFNNNSIFEVTVGYPDSNYVMSFNVENDMAWSLLYNNASISDEYIYYIDDSGSKRKDYSPNFFSSSSNINEIQKNWWTQMTHFPINASLTLKGFMRPVMLMDYVIVNVVFYGQRHITSGVYTITGQKDTLSGDGFRTTLALTRVGAN